MFYLQSATPHFFPEVQAEIYIFALHFPFRGRHSGKGPAVVSNQSKVVMQWKTDCVACLRTQNEDLCFLSEKGSYILQIIMFDTRFLSIILKWRFAKCMSLYVIQFWLLPDCYKHIILSDIHHELLTHYLLVIIPQ